MNRFFINRQDVNENKVFITDKEDVHHILKVLRLKKNEKIEISDAIENEYLAEICDMSGDCITCNIIEKIDFSREPGMKITLFQGLPKQGKMELIIQKSVELGVSEITPCIFKRSINSDIVKADKKNERWQKIAKEAAGQSRRKIIPKVNQCLDLKLIESELENFDLILIAYEDERKTVIKDVLSQIRNLPVAVAIIIGPEGGFEHNEVEVLETKGGISVSLGKAILRTETAGICALSMLKYAMDM
ncbi:MAG: RsmE family RNA methyltransferase [Eubacteriales bacterium]